MPVLTKKTKASKAKLQAFKDLKKSEPSYYLPFLKWMDKYVFQN